jgi:DNA polymerase III alpha subunit (gram-positive type)
MLLRFTIYKLLIKKIEQIRDFGLLLLNEEMKGDLWEFFHELIEQKKPKIIAESLVIHRIFELIWARLLIIISRRKSLLLDEVENILHQKKNNHIYDSDAYVKHNQMQNCFDYSSSQSHPNCNILCQKRRKHTISKLQNKFIPKITKKNTIFGVITLLIIICLASIISKCGGSASPLISYNENVNKLHSSILTPAVASSPKSSNHKLQQRQEEKQQRQAEAKQLEAEQQQRRAEAKQLEAEQQQRQAEAKHWLTVAQEKRKEAMYWLDKAQDIKGSAKNVGRIPTSYEKPKT